jgi:aquaporin Z
MSATPATRLCAEAFGTFCLVFAGTGAVVVNEVTGGGVTHENLSQDLD